MTFPHTWSRLMPLSLVGLLIAAGCSMAGGTSDLSGLLGSGSGGSTGAPPSSRAPRTQARTGADLLSSAELARLYSTILDTYVDSVQPSVLVTGALQGAHQAAIEAGMMPVESAILDTAPLQFSGDPDRDWIQLARLYDSFLKKMGPRADVAPIGRASAQGMLDSLADPTVAYLPRTSAQAQRSSQYAGIGVVLAGSLIDGHPVVREVVVGGPAERAGVRIGDVILAADNRPTDSMTLGGAVAAIRGPDGSTVPLTLRSSGESGSHQVSVRRALVQLNPLISDMRDGVGYLRLRSFEDGISDSVRRALLDSRSAGARGWIIDLRGTDGGSFQEAVNAASLFLGGQTITLQEDRFHRRVPVVGNIQPLGDLLPSAVIVDETTGGPAEIFAAALQDHQSAVLVGQRTAGKAAITSSVALSDGSVAQIPTQRLLSPSGAQIHRVGLSPDQVVLEHVEDWVAGRDLQFERAIGSLAQPA